MINAIGSVLKKVFGTKNDRELKRMAPIVERINSLEDKMRSLRDEDFLRLTEQFRTRIKDGEGLENILPEAYALVREAARRRLDMRHFDVQLVGGVVLHEGKIAEMKTGEGKTLVATLPLYLNALAGRGAHLVTVNDYLARRDTQWMGPIYHALGLSVGVIQHEASYIYDPTYRGEDKSHFHLRPCSRKEAYHADITYGTNNEFGFDYLRDNMKFSLEDYVQRELYYAIVDEVDSILVDEARTPLIISGPAEESTDKYYRIDSIIPLLNGELHYTVDEKARQVHLTEEGMQRVEELLKIDNLYDPRHIDTLHHVNQALRAHVLFRRDVDYVVKDGKVVIVDEFTGRLMPGRRWSDGLHQAIEAKERVEIENENQTLASITFQNYFRMYEKLAGMTGTADTEAHEFKAIYNLDVVVVPTHRPMIRNDHPDLIYKTKKEKFRAVVREIRECYKAGRPVLVGTISIEDSEKLSSMLKREGVSHNVLNAKHHEREAEIVAQAGRLHAVTISTNMAGRGTDIILGGNPEFLAKAKAGFDDTTEDYKRAYEEARRTCEEEKKKVLELGGLHIIGTERHESRRIDNQLRGRSGRQGDPGSSRFYISLEDDLMRIFGSDRVAAIMGRLGMEEDTPIEHSLVTKAVESAQKKVEAHNFDIRKHLLEYDDVMNQQRQTIYEYRKQILAEQGLHEMIREFVEEVVADMVDSVAEEKMSPEEWNLKGLCDHLFSQFAIKMEPHELGGVRDREELSERLFERLWKHYEEKRARIGDDVMGHVEKIIMLHTLDTLWKDHLLTMDHLKGGIGLRGYGQKNPLNEYKREGYQLFTEMIQRLRADVTGRLFKVEVQEEAAVSELEERAGPQNVTLSRGTEPQATATENARAQPVRRAGKKVGRNEPCPCGSGKKYKKCCGR